MVAVFTFLCTLVFTGLAFAHGVADADKASLVSGGNLDYVWQGAKHMVTGYDHLLFLFGVIFFLSKFKDIVKFITAFTIGHSITLIFATFYEITANYYLIDAVIALSVCYKGFENIGGFQKYLNMKSPNLQWAVFIFGLIHGFGLSTRLQQLPLGDDGLLLKIISFNVGVEFGQIAALSVMLIFLTQWRKTESFKKFSVASNIGLIIVGTGLFVFQMSGFFSEAAREKPHVHAAHGTHKHGDGPAHADHVTEPLRATSQMHSHDGGPMHIDKPAPVEAKPVEQGHSHGGGAPHTH